MNRMNLRQLFVSICIILLGGSCIKNDIPYPVIPLQFLSFEVEGQAGSAIIDKDTRTVTVPLADTVNLKKVIVKRCTVTEGVEAPLDSAAVLDLSTPKRFTMSLYQDYEWTIQASQEIERNLVVKQQFGKPVFNTTLHQVVAYITNASSQKRVYIKSLKLGPEGITTMEPELPLDEPVDFSFPKTVTVRYHDIVEEWTIMVSRSDKNVSTGAADAFVNVAWLHGNGEEGADNGFEMKMEGDEEWERVADELVTDDGGELTACISGLKANTTYICRAFSGTDYGDEVTFTTGEPVTLPGGLFEDWHLEGKVWNPWALEATSIWDSGNDGTTTMGDSNTQPTDDTWNGKGKAARLESRFVGLGSIGKFAAGNLFMGNFVGVDGTNGILDFGRPFTARPVKLKGYYKYSTAPISYVASGFESLKEKPDTCAIYIALGDWSEPVRIRTKSSDQKMFDKNDSHIIAYAELNSGETVTEYKKFELTLDYRDTGRIPTYLIIVCSASKYGDYFVGGAGSVLYVDDFSLDYDY